MAKKKNGTKALVLGTVLGFAAGAAYALWKTPQSGKDLRAKLNPAQLFESTGASGTYNTLLDAVEHTLAPLVGVQLGKTANDGGTKPTSETGPIAEPQASNGSQDPAAGGGWLPTPPHYDWGATAPEVTRPAAVATTEQPSSETSATTSHEGYGSASIRAKKFAWGSPAPEATPAAEATPAHEATTASQPEAAAEPEAAPAIDEDATATAAPGTVAAEVIATAEENEAEPSSYGLESIRSKRFSWGGDVDTPEDEATEDVEDSVAPVDDDDLNAVEKGGEPALQREMSPFPKLGGLE